MDIASIFSLICSIQPFFPSAARFVCAFHSFFPYIHSFIQEAPSPPSYQWVRVNRYMESCWRTFVCQVYLGLLFITPITSLQPIIVQPHTRLSIEYVIVPKGHINSFASKIQRPLEPITQKMNGRL